MTTPAGWKLAPHSPDKLSRIPWPVCRACGLVFLSNDLTRWAVKHGCNYKEHPSWAAQVRRTGSP